MRINFATSLIDFPKLIECISLLKIFNTGLCKDETKLELLKNRLERVISPALGAGEIHIFFNFSTTRLITAPDYKAYFYTPELSF